MSIKFIRSEGGQVYPNGTFCSPDGVFTDAEKACAKFIRDYNQTSIETTNLFKSFLNIWTRQGIKSGHFQQEYFNRLQGLINAILPKAKDDNAAWTEQQALDWIAVMDRYLGFQQTCVVLLFCLGFLNYYCNIRICFAETIASYFFFFATFANAVVALLMINL